MTLGEYIRETRKKKALTAKEVLEHSKIHATPAMFSQWETGKRIPPPVDLERLCDFLGMNPRICFSLWAKEHMPTEHLARLFDVESSRKEVPSIFSTPFEAMPYPAAITKTISRSDIEFFTAYPDAIGIVLRCITASNEYQEAWPADRLVAGLGFTRTQGDLAIRELVKRGYIVEEGTKKYRMEPGIEHLYMPDKEEFEPIRRARIATTTPRLLTRIPLKDHISGSAFRVILTNKLSKKRREQLIGDIRRISQQFMNDPDASEAKGSSYYQIVVAMGPEHEKTH